eukprot:scaffold5876_cov129-Isochrysis_galbana.AAC.2
MPARVRRATEGESPAVWRRGAPHPCRNMQALYTYGGRPVRGWRASRAVVWLARLCRVYNLIIKNLKKKALHTSGDSAGHPAALAGGWFKSCVHYNSLRLGLENLGENVEPSYVRVHLDSLRADYG